MLDYVSIKVFLMFWGVQSQRRLDIVRDKILELPEGSLLVVLLQHTEADLSLISKQNSIG